MQLQHQKIALDVNETRAFTVLNAHQGDSKTRFIDITLTENGNTITLSSSYVATVKASINNKTKAVNTAVVNSTNNVITVELTKTMLDTPGLLNCEVVLQDNQQFVTSATFTVKVAESVISDESAIVASQEFGKLLDALIEIKDIEDKADRVQTLVDNIDKLESANDIVTRLNNVESKETQLETQHKTDVQALTDKANSIVDQANTDRQNFNNSVDEINTTLDTKENVSNKVSEITHPSLDYYPDTKAVFDYVNSKLEIPLADIESLKSGKLDKTDLPTAILSDTPSDTTTFSSNKVNALLKEKIDTVNNNLVNKADKSEIVKSVNDIAPDENGNVEIEIYGGGGGLTEGFATALLNCFRNVAWINENGQTFIDTLNRAIQESVILEKEVVSITVTYNGSSTVMVGRETNTLDITVRATYDDGTVRKVLGFNTSPQTIVEGNNTITVSYKEKTSTFTVIGENIPIALDRISAIYSGAAVGIGTPLDSLKENLIVKAYYNDGSSVTVSDYTLSGSIIEGNNTITVSYNDKVADFVVIGEKKTLVIVDGDKINYQYTQSPESLDNDTPMETGIVDGVLTLECSISTLVHTFTFKDVDVTGINTLYLSYSSRGVYKETGKLLLSGESSSTSFNESGTSKTVELDVSSVDGIKSVLVKAEFSGYTGQFFKIHKLWGE